MLLDAWRDLQYAIRMFGRAPGFTAVVAITLALGIGANAAIFSVVDAILLRDAPIADPSRVFSIFRTSADGRQSSASGSYPDYADLRDSGVLAGVAAFAGITIAVDRDGVVEQVTGEIVSGNYFDVLGVGMARGRAFHQDEDRVGAPVRVAVVSHRFWQERLGGNSDVVGQSLRINGNAFTVVGATRPGFGLLLGRAPDVWVPMALQQEVRPPTAGLRRQLGHSNLLIRRDGGWINVVGRLKPETSVQQTASAMDGVARQLESQYADTNRGRRFALVPLGDGPGVRTATAPLLRVLSGAVLLVLLIACANVASLLAARALARRREVAVRMAIGAKRGRLIRQWLTESVLLAAIGAAGAVLVAYWATPIFYRLGVPESVDLSLNPRVLGFTLFAGFASGLAFGLAPVVQAIRGNTFAVLREESGSIASSVIARRMRNSFIVVQVALTLVLLVASGLFLQTLRNAYALDLGYRVEGVLVSEVNLDLRGYSQEAGQQVYRRLLDGINGLPGVQSAGASRVAVLTGGSRTGGISLDGRPAAQDGSNAVTVRINVISDRYLETMGIPLLHGRTFQASDDERAMRVAIVSRSLADRLWPGQDPIGRPLEPRPNAPTVIGVVKDAAYTQAVEPNALPVYYVPLAQNYESGVALHVRTEGDPLDALPGVRGVLREIDPQLVLARPRTFAQDFDTSVGSQRLMAILIGAFGGLALVLAAVGLYGTMSHAVGQRRAEIGLRMVLGARHAQIFWMVVGQGLKLVALGSALGFVGALAASRFVEGQLFGVKPMDPATYVGVAIVLALVAAIACAIPARRAIRGY